MIAGGGHDELRNNLNLQFFPFMVKIANGSVFKKVFQKYL